jgi:hypothetical protein
MKKKTCENCARLVVRREEGKFLMNLDTYCYLDAKPRKLTDTCKKWEGIPE